MFATAIAVKPAIQEPTRFSTLLPIKERHIAAKFLSHHNLMNQSMEYLMSSQVVIPSPLALTPLRKAQHAMGQHQPHLNQQHNQRLLWIRHPLLPNSRQPKLPVPKQALKQLRHPKPVQIPRIAKTAKTAKAAKAARTLQAAQLAPPAAPQQQVQQAQQAPHHRPAASPT